MGWFRKFFKKSAMSKNLSSGASSQIDHIPALEDSTRMIIELNDGFSAKIIKKGFESLSHTEKVLHHVYWLELEVNNGGFEQYFANSAGDYALDTPSALSEIGAHSTANLVQRAMGLFPNGKPSRNRVERVAQIDSMDEADQEEFDDLDAEFYEYHDPLAELQVKYMAANRDKIQI